MNTHNDTQQDPDDFMVDPFKGEDGMELAEEASRGAQVPSPTSYMAPPMILTNQSAESQPFLNSYYENAQFEPRGEQHMHMIRQSSLINNVLQRQSQQAAGTAGSIYAQPVNHVESMSNQSLLRSLSTYRIQDGFNSAGEHQNLERANGPSQTSAAVIFGSEDHYQHDEHSVIIPPFLTDEPSCQPDYTDAAQKYSQIDDGQNTPSPILSLNNSLLPHKMTSSEGGLSATMPLPQQAYVPNMQQTQYQIEEQLKAQQDEDIVKQMNDEKNIPQIHQIKTYIEPSKTHQILEFEGHEQKTHIEPSASRRASMPFNCKNYTNSEGTMMVNETTYVRSESKTAQTCKNTTKSTYPRYQQGLQRIEELFDKNLFEKINEFDHIQKTEQYLERMKTEIKDKKKLQKERNVLTAQLSRDRKKLELEMLRESCYSLIQNLNMVRNTLNQVISKAQGSETSNLRQELQQKFKFVFQNCEIYETDETKSQTDATLTENSGSDLDAADNLTRSISPTDVNLNNQEQVKNYETYANKPSLVSKVTRVNQKLQITSNDFDQDGKSLTSENLSIEQISSKTKRKLKQESKQLIGKRKSEFIKSNDLELTSSFDDSDVVSKAEQINRPEEVSDAQPGSSQRKGNQNSGFTFIKNKRINRGTAAVGSLFLLATCMLAMFGIQSIPGQAPDLDYENDFENPSQEIPNFRRRLQDINQTLEQNDMMQSDDEDGTETKEKKRKMRMRRVAQNKKEHLEQVKVDQHHEAEREMVKVNDAQNWTMLDEQARTKQKQYIDLEAEEFDSNKRVELAPSVASTPREPCSTFKSRSFLQQTYMVENIREGFIEKEVKKICHKDRHQDSDYIMDIDQDGGPENLTTVVYQSHQSQAVARAEADANKSMQVYKSQTCSPIEVKRNIRKINDTHTTIYSPNPQVILPSGGSGNLNMNFSQFNQNMKGGTIKKPAHSHLHVILPAKDINVLNNQKFQSSSEHGKGNELGNDEMFIEIGCKIDSVEYLLRAKE